MSRALLALALIGCGRIGFDPAGDDPVTLESARGHLARGGDHACALRGEEVWCWGDGREGQTGTGAAGISPTPVMVADLPAAKYVATGRLDSCAITLTGGVYCWGYNGYKQAGPQMKREKPLIVPFEDPHPDKIPGLPGPAIEVGVGADHACALIEDGTVACWGRDNFGQLGRDHMEDAGFDAAPVQGLASVAHLSIDDDSSCAIDTAGKIWCWGENSSGQLGDGMTAPRALPFEIPDLVGKDVSIGSDHTCVLMLDGHVACWGQNSSSELGNNDTAQTFTPVISVRSGYLAVESGERHTCAITATEDVECWGIDGYGESGNPSFTNVGTPTLVADLSNVASVSAGLTGTCALRTDGKVKCWGLSQYGQIGDGTLLETKPQPVTGISGATEVVAGQTSSCSLGAGVVTCWGENWAGQLGDGTFTTSMTPVTVQKTWTGTATDIASGFAHVCALIDSGEVWCWGVNDSGELGDNTLEYRNVPVQVTGLPATSAIALGAFASCALAGTEIWCWGANNHGQLGNNSMNDSKIPVLVGAGFSAVAMGSDHTCGIGGGVQCWGDNRSSQIGDGGTTDRSTPFVIGGFTALKLWAGGSSTCVDTTGNGVLCWGASDQNMLQVPTGVAPTTPTSSLLPTNSVLGSSIACYPTNTDIECIGANGSGMLGDGTFDSRDTFAPTVRPSGGAPTQVSLGSSHACAVLADGGIACWGDNTYGEIGNGKQNRSATPAIVLFP